VERQHRFSHRLLKTKIFFHFNEKHFSFCVKFFFIWETKITQGIHAEAQGCPGMQLTVCNFSQIMVDGKHSGNNPIRLNCGVNFALLDIYKTINQPRYTADGGNHD
jgi:hypothetical protein